MSQFLICGAEFLCVCARAVVVASSILFGRSIIDLRSMTQMSSTYPKCPRGTLGFYVLWPHPSKSWRWNFAK